MLTFIVPLKSAKVSKSWDKVVALLRRTLQSICNQNSPEFSVLVVCHDIPDVGFEHPAIQYVQVDFPPPSSVDCDLKAKNRDRNLKVFVGLEYSKKLSPSHVMVVDSDVSIQG